MVKRTKRQTHLKQARAAKKQKSGGEQGDAGRAPPWMSDLSLPQGNQGTQHQTEPGPSRPHQGQEDLPRQTEREEAPPAPQRTNVRAEPPAPLPLPVGRRPFPLHFSTAHRLKPFTAKCSKCGARHWLEERTSGSAMQSPEFSM